MLDRTNSPQGDLLNGDPTRGDSPNVADSRAMSPNATTRRAMLIEGAKDFDRKNPAESAEEIADRMLQSGRLANNEPDADADQGDWIWTVEEQAEITTRALANGGVEIVQAGQHGPDDDTTIHVSAHNAVQLARNILFAAGFPGVLIATGTHGGFSDVEDGDTPDKFKPRKSAPVVSAINHEAVAKAVQAITAAAAKPEPEPATDWSNDAPNVIVPHQPGIRVFTNENGDVTLHQRSDDLERDDALVCIVPANVPAVIKAMQAEVRGRA
jgi:hypothetical protein